MDDQDTGVKEQWGEPGRVRERAYAADEPPTDHRTAEIRSDIEQTRADMSETIEAIQDRLRPGNLVSQAKETVREATVGKVKQVADSARNSLRSRGYSSDYGTGYGESVMDRIRANPIPAALAVASVAWIAMKGNTRSRPRTGPAIYGSTADGEAYVRETVISEDMDDDSWSDEEPLSRRTRSMATGVTDRMRGATARMRHATAGTRDGLERVARGNPLAAGAIAAAVGLTIGLALPETERENELMGEARDTVVNRAKDAARGAAERVQEAASRVQDVAADTARSMTPDDQA
jgi:ElaB/YqjD/DUF883 family membrane-anchored ribosome-binding protein